MKDSQIPGVHPALFWISGPDVFFWHSREIHRSPGKALVFLLSLTPGSQYCFPSPTMKWACHPVDRAAHLYHLAGIRVVKSLNVLFPLFHVGIAQSDLQRERVSLCQLHLVNPNLDLRSLCVQVHCNKQVENVVRVKVFYDCTHILSGVSVVLFSFIREVQTSHINFRLKQHIHRWKLKTNSTKWCGYCGHWLAWRHICSKKVLGMASWSF